MPTDTRIQKMLDLAATQVGYREGRKNGRWTNHTKYAPQVPGLEWAQDQPWCAVFVYWCFLKSGIVDLLPSPRTAWVPNFITWAKQHGQWSEYPAVGAPVIFGGGKHVGIVESYTADTITTIEGNTNTTGSPEGDGVYRKVHRRRDDWVTGYLYPAVPLDAADPAYKGPPVPKPKPVLGVDYSFARPKPATIKAAGYSAVGRYLSHSPSKNINSVEAKGLHAAGLGVWLVWETNAKRASAGYAAGVADAKDALFQANTFGVPNSCPLFFAVDFDAAYTTVSEYLSGARSVVGDRVGVYGGYKITTAARANRFLFTWQTMAWSAGRVDADANILQRLRPTVAHPIQDTDENLIQHPFPLWGPL